MANNPLVSSLLSVASGVNYDRESGSSFKLNGIILASHLHIQFSYFLY